MQCNEFMIFTMNQITTLIHKFFLKIIKIIHFLIIVNNYCVKEKLIFNNK